MYLGQTFYATIADDGLSKYPILAWDATVLLDCKFRQAEHLIFDIYAIFALLTPAYRNRNMWLISSELFQLNFVAWSVMMLLGDGGETS